MFKILIVDDEQEKRRLITDTLLRTSGISLDNIFVATDVYSAKKRLSKDKYDLLLLDINLPRRADQRPEIDAGLDILRFIKTHPSALSPTYIVGMTAYEESATAALAAFSSPLWKLVVFSFSDNSWQAPLEEAAAYMVALHLPPYANDGRTNHIDLGIVVALEDEEMASIRALPANWRVIPVRYDAAVYFEGEFVCPAGHLRVVAVAAPKMGMPAAAVTATKLIHAFRPRYLAIAGICVGVRKKTNIGDILLADPCFDWGSGKWVQEDSRELRFRPAPYPWRLNETLRSAARQLGDCDSLRDRIYNEFTGKKPPNPPTIIIDAMASGGSVLQAQKLVDDVSELHKNLVGIEMESYAVFTAAEYAAEPRPTCFSIKSVCDFGDEDKETIFHAYAAHTSARFLFEFAVTAIQPLNSEIVS